MAPWRHFFTAKSLVSLWMLGLCALLVLTTFYNPLDGGFHSDRNTRIPKPTSTMTTHARTTQIPAATQQLLQENPELFWDCDREDTPCRYLEPFAFWKEEFNGISEEDYKKWGGYNNNLPAMTALSYADDNHHFRVNLSFIHVHKCGGTTVKSLLASAKQRLIKFNKDKIMNVNSISNVQLQHYKYSFGGSSAAHKRENQERRQSHIDEMAQLQLKKSNLQDNKNQAVVFTVVRDPLERFVSAVQQVMHYHTDFRHQCLKWTAQATLQCAIHWIADTNYGRDVHLLPIMTHFRLWDAVPHFKISVLHLDNITSLAAYLDTLGQTGNNYDNNHSNSISSPTTTTSMVVHARDRSHLEYATSKVLARMSVKDCTPAMVQQLCDLYALDVAMMKLLGYPSQYCYDSDGE